MTSLASFGPDVSRIIDGSTLTQGRDGNFYGTTETGGANNLGTVFKLTPTGTLTVLHEFASNEGSDPSTPLVQAGDSNFYGTTFAGGASDASGTAGRGSVYKITPDGVFTILYTFHGSDGKFPIVELLAAKDGNLYGGLSVADTGSSKGAVFKITPEGVLTILHRFGGPEGQYPNGRLVQGSDGTIYGTTTYGGVHGNGVVYALAADGTTRTVHEFSGVQDGQDPDRLVLANDGNLYGLTVSSLIGSGGTGNTPDSIYPVVFRLTPAGAFTVLHTFTTSNSEVESPTDLVQGRDGNLYGTTLGTGLNTNTDPNGLLFRVTPTGDFASLYTFDRSSAGPTQLLVGSDGNFYGTTLNGGTNDTGTIFKLVSYSRPAFFAGEVALSNGVSYLTFPNGNVFGYYSFLSDPNYLYHFDMGYEYVFDAADGHSGVYLYDFASSTFFYTSPTFPFPYLYDFTLNTVLYYYPDPNNPGRYNTNGTRYFYNFATGKIITK